MADPTVALVVLAGAVFLLCAVIVLLVWLQLDAHREWRAERTQLLNRVMSSSPREFAVLEKALAPKDERPEATEPEHPMVGSY